MIKTYVDTAASPELWKKGQLHSHTLWSDGRSFPEEAVYSYKQLGFDFLCLSDHNIFQEDEENVYLPLRCDEGHWPPCATLERYQRLCELFGEDVCRTRQLSYRTFVRLTPFQELEARFKEEGRFILIPGSEITWNTWTDEGILHDCHANVLNIAATLPHEAGKVPAETYRNYYRDYLTAAAEAKRPTFFMANHPWWRNWDYFPQDLLDNPEIRHFEICNSGTTEGADSCMEIMSPDKFWDIVLAHRLEDGGNMLYGAGSDDAHFYEESGIGKVGHQGSAWVNVRVPGELTPDNVTAALDRGDYYATTGVVLDKVEYNTDTRELHVAVKAEPGVSYRIEFYATRRGFDRSVTTRYCEHPQRKELSRNMPIYAEEIGRLVTAVDGAEATCAANADDLYIRAKVISSVEAVPHKSACHPTTLTAWTQPVKI